MHALHFENGVATVRDDVPEPEPRAGECRVRVLHAGVCATDLALRRGYMQFAGVPGHEFVGVALDGPLAGRRVVGEINAACGRCAFCAHGLERHCPDRTVLGIFQRPGAFAEQLSLPVANLHPVPDAVPDELAVFVEPLAAAFEIVEQVPIAAGTRVLVTGDGKLGLLCAWVLHLHGADVTIAGRHPERAALLPASVPHEGDVLAAPPPTAGEAYELAVEATGRPDALARLVAFVRPRGTIVLKTTCERPSTVDLAPVVVQELTLVGSRCGPFAPALAELARGRIPLQGFVAARYPLQDALAAFEHAGRSGTLKVLVACT